MKIIRTICCFSKDPSQQDVALLHRVADLLKQHGFEIQTLRLCAPRIKPSALESLITEKDVLLSVGEVDLPTFNHDFDDFIHAERTSCCLNLSDEKITVSHADVLFRLIREAPHKTFNFSYVFNNPASSPYFPSAKYKEDGFAIGLQPTNLTQGCTSLDEWLKRMKEVWRVLHDLLTPEKNFLGIDSSIASLFAGESSLVSFIKKIQGDFSSSLLTDTYLSITDYIKKENPKPVGLCGLMVPCLEDFILAQEYERGNFPLERNLFLSLHSGLGIDTYPIGADEEPEKVRNILSLVQGLSRKYQKPLSVRFVSDGKAKIGEWTNFQNQYLQDVTVRPL